MDEIVTLDASATEMRAKRRPIEMLRNLEESLALRIQKQGREHPDVQNAAEKLVKDYNSVAMQLLREGEIQPREGFIHQCSRRI